MIYSFIPFKVDLSFLQRPFCNFNKEKMVQNLHFRLEFSYSPGNLCLFDILNKFKQLRAFSQKGMIMVSGKRILAENTELILFERFLDPEVADQWFLRLCENTPWQQDRIKLFGKECDIPRLQSWYGDPECDYCYSGLAMEPKAWTPDLLVLKQQVEQVAHISFNSVLINLYRDGRDSNGWHADNEPELGINPVIASLSLGAVRRFRLRQIADHKATVNLDLPHGSLLLMAGATQSYWQHCITKTTRAVKPRINLTFRQIQK